MGRDVNSGSPWRAAARIDKTKQTAEAGGADHGPMARGRVSLRMKMSRPC